jgi:hypothetical protein
MKTYIQCLSAADSSAEKDDAKLLSLKARAEQRGRSKVT